MTLLAASTKDWLDAMEEYEEIGRFDGRLYEYR